MSPETTALIPQIGLGGVLGYAAGYATQKVLKIAFFIAGIVYIALQILAYYGFVDVHWYAIQKAADPLLQEPALTRGFDSFMTVLKTNLPFAGGFGGGFLLGLRAR